MHVDPTVTKMNLVKKFEHLLETFSTPPPPKAKRRHEVDRQTDMYGVIKRSPLTLDRAQHVKTLLEYIGYQGCRLNVGLPRLNTDTL
jgi:hypothetical protein